MVDALMPNEDPSATLPANTMAERFRGFLPVVIDVETGGFDANRNALLEIAAVPIQMDEDGKVYAEETWHAHVEPFPGARIEEAALEFNGIVPDHPFRFAKPEREVLEEMFGYVRQVRKAANCTRAILVGHNAAFDLGFMNAAIKRCQYKRNPFHQFSCFDTVSLAGLAYGQTVLARACQAAGIDFDHNEAHSARYDAERTAELFCKIINRWQHLELMDSRNDAGT